MFKKIGEWIDSKKDIIKAAISGFWEGWCVGAGVCLLLTLIYSIFANHKRKK